MFILAGLGGIAFGALMLLGGLALLGDKNAAVEQDTGYRIGGMRVTREEKLGAGPGCLSMIFGLGLIGFGIWACYRGFFG